MMQEIESVLEALETIGKSDVHNDCIICLASQCKRRRLDSKDNMTKKMIEERFCDGLNNNCGKNVKTLNWRAVFSVFQQQCLEAS